jgi:uncharacterized protein involved in outer membrane biogenesis
MRRRKKLVLIAILLSLPLLLLTGVVLYVTLADLSGWRDTVAGILSDSLGREVQIAGEFAPDIGLTTRLTAGGITVANPDWSDDATMVSVRRLAFELDLLSLISGPITIHDVTIEGVRVLLETDAEGRANWEFDGGGESDDTGGRLELVLRHVLVEDLQLTTRDPSRPSPVELGITRLESTADDAGMLDLTLDGTLGDDEIELAGRFGTLDGLLNAEAFEYDLTGRLGGVQAASDGRIVELATLGGADLKTRIDGDDLADLRNLLPSLTDLDGAFNISCEVSPTAAGFDVHLTAEAAGLTAEVAATVDSFLEPRIVDATVTAAGPSIRTVGTLTGVTDLPEEPFSVSGGLRWEGFPVTFRQVEITVGDNTLSADGVLGEPPSMEGSDFSLRGRGPDIAAIGGLAGVELPHEPFSVNGRVVRIANGLKVDNVEARVGAMKLSDYTGTILQFHGDGSDLAHLQDLAGIALPAEPFEIDGRLTQGDGAIRLDQVRARLGSNTLAVDGQLTTESRFAGTDLKIQAGGPDASQLAAMADISDVPAERYSVEGRVRVLDKGYRVNGLIGSLGSLAVTVDGFVTTRPMRAGSDLQIHVEDTDISHLASIAGITDLPHDSFNLDSRVRVEESGYRLDDFEAAIGGIEARVNGLVGSPPGLNGTDVRIEARGSRLDALGPYLEQENLPGAPFSVSGGVRVVDASYLLDQVRVSVEDHRAAFNGTVMPADHLAGTDLELDIRGPDLSEAGGLAAGFAELPELPAEPYSLTGRVAIDGSGYELRNIEATLAAAVAKLTGRVGVPPELLGSDLVLDLDGPNASLFTAVTGVMVPVAPFHLTGRVERNESGFRFHEIAAQLGEYRAAIDGSLGNWPGLIGTELLVRTSGPGTRLIGELAGKPGLPDQPFEIAGEFSGTPERFTVQKFSAQFGPSDLSGSLRVALLDTPEVEAKFTSNHLDLTSLEEEPGPSEAEPPFPKTPPEPTAEGMVISDEPFEFDALERAEGQVVLSIGELVTPAQRLRDFELGVRLKEGSLFIDRLAAVGSLGARLDGGLELEPAGAGYNLHARLRLEQGRFDFTGAGGDPSRWSPVDIDFEITAAGRSPHGLASNATGHGQIVIGQGIFEYKLADLLVAGIFSELLKLLNPFRGEEKTTELQCAVFAVGLEDGLARLEPLAIQTDKMTILGEGEIDLGTEELDLQWVTKPRKGIGLSASMITNPYIKLGGTLSDPSIQLKELQAVTSTGAAVATLGLSFVAKGMYDRVSAEKKVCKKALEKISRQSGETSKK